MNKQIKILFLIMALAGLSACNIMPKSVQYQKEEEKLIGSTEIINPIVEEIQVVLSSLGYDTEAKDGKMTQKTRDAIKEFQESLGIKATGYLDNNTLTQLEDIRRANEEKALGKDSLVKVRPAGSSSASAGAKYSGQDIQTALKNAGFDVGAIDGKIGPKTRQAIMEFQKSKGLNPDGVVGSKTWAELGKYLNQ